MEPEINTQIREALEKYGVASSEIKDGLSLVGALSTVFWANRKEHYRRVQSMIDSHGFMQYLLGEAEYKQKEK